MTDPQSWAAWAGTHPVAVWGAGLALALAIAAGAWGAARAAAPRCAPWFTRWSEPRHAVPRLLVAMGASALLLWACAELLGEIAQEWAAPTAWARLDQVLAATLRDQAGVPTLTLFARLTHAGDKEVLTVLAIGVAIALWWRRHRLLAAGWVAALAGNGLLTRGFKHAFERVRPEHTHGVSSADGFSFPSGHSSSALVAYGMLAYLALRLLPPRWHLPALLAAVAVAFTVGWSRVVLQVHYASDVLAGWVTGGVWLACSMMVMNGVGHWHRGRSAALPA
ncbi:phosphatase PAP2 family protein [Acidovorax sp. GBBC 3334]|uniref:phosphatase PAP2 family protein n=1 Tax=Acidovorax sp. GBBC 3334 TaxID=2940496 RepID=UPI0023031A7E|nr:phosphatase PAP2 family protein [Acidovorax sp. GBBC 3334]MDA8454859.1 phosphatase PAP2 family protein [Acidovorax sp. GBBC 3334]